MSDKFNNIEDLFRKGLENFEADVDPNIWQNISSQIGSQAPVPDSSSAVSSPSSSSIMGSAAVKVAAVAITAGVISVGTYFALKKDKTDETTNEEKIEKVIEAAPVTNEAKEDIPAVRKVEKEDVQVISAETDESISVAMDKEDEAVEKTEETTKAVTAAKGIEKTVAAASAEKLSDQARPAEKPVEKSPVQKTPAEKQQTTVEDERKKPEASIYASLKSGKLPLSVRFENHGTYAPQARWIINGEEQYETRPKFSHIFEESGAYWVVLEISDENGSRSRDSVEITVEDDYYVNIPKAFSPNGDGINDAFVIETEGVSSLKCTILDRAGNLVYKYDSVYGHWDGKDMAGNEQPAGIYFCIVEIVDANGKSQEPKKTTVSLYRSN